MCARTRKVSIRNPARFTLNLFNILKLGSSGNTMTVSENLSPEKVLKAYLTVPCLRCVGSTDADFAVLDQT